MKGSSPCHLQQLLLRAVSVVCVVQDKTRADWHSFVAKEGIREELTTFNRGREGFVARQDFLTRVDLRQFEHEREARLRDQARRLAASKRLDS